MKFICYINRCSKCIMSNKIQQLCSQIYKKTWFSVKEANGKKMVLRHSKSYDGFHSMNKGYLTTI